MDILSNELSIQDSCDIIGVRYSDDMKTVRANFTKLAFEHHPDKGGDKHIFDLISKAYKCLKDAKRVNCMPENDITYNEMLGDDTYIDKSEFVRTKEEKEDANKSFNKSFISKQANLKRSYPKNDQVCYREYDKRTYHEGTSLEYVEEDLIYKPLENLEFKQNVVYKNTKEDRDKESSTEIDYENPTDSSQVFGMVEYGKMSTTFGNSKSGTLGGYELGSAHSDKIKRITIYEDINDDTDAELENKFERKIRERGNFDISIQQNMEPVSKRVRDENFSEKNKVWRDKFNEEKKENMKILGISDSQSHL